MWRAGQRLRKRQKQAWDGGTNEVVGRGRHGRTRAEGARSGSKGMGEEDAGLSEAARCGERERTLTERAGDWGEEGGEIEGDEGAVTVEEEAAEACLACKGRHRPHTCQLGGRRRPSSQGSRQAERQKGRGAVGAANEGPDATQAGGGPGNGAGSGR